MRTIKILEKRLKELFKDEWSLITTDMRKILIEDIINDGIDDPGLIYSVNTEQGIELRCSKGMAIYHAYKVADYKTLSHSDLMI